MKTNTNNKQFLINRNLMKNFQEFKKILGDIFCNVNDIYNLEYNNIKEIQFSLIQSNFKYHYDENEFYRNSCIEKNISPSDIKTFEDLIKIPLIPVKKFKDINSHLLLTKPLSEIEYEMRSTGTSGIPSVSRRDSDTVDNAIVSLYSMYREFFKLSSGAILFLMPSTEDIPEMGMIKVLGMLAGLTDANFYAMRGKEFRKEDALQLLHNWENKHTRHIVGPPFLVHKFIDYLKKSDIKVKLDNKSLIINLGGWKRFTGQQIEREEYNQECFEYLGVKPENIRDMYGLVESNSLAIECEYGKKHVSPWCHYSVRSLDDLSVEVPYGERGVLAILDPISYAYPTFILTEDLVYLDDSVDCKCGRNGQKVNYITRVRGAEIGCCAINLEKQMNDAEASAVEQNCTII